MDNLYDADGRLRRRRPVRFTDEPQPNDGPSVDDLILEHGGLNSMIAVREKPGGPVLNLLPTGAVVTNNGFGPSFRHPPEPGTLANLKARRRYHALCLKRDEAAFAKCKAALLGPASDDYPVAAYEWNEKSHGPMPGRPGAEWLERIKGCVVRHRAAVAELDRAIAATPEERERRARERERDAIEVEAAAFAATARRAVQAVTLDE